MPRLLEDAAGWLFDVVGGFAENLGELITWLFTGLLVGAVEGRHLVPGTNPGAGERLEARVAADQADRVGDNAWPEFRHLCATAREVSRATHARELERVNIARVRDGLPTLAWEELDFTVDEVVKPTATEEQRAYTHRTIDDLRRAGVFEMQQAMKGDRRFVRPISPGLLMDTDKPEVGSVRQMVRVGVARMYFAHRAGNHDELITALDQSLAIITPVTLQGTLIDHIVGLASRDVVFAEVRRELIEDPPPVEHLRRMAALIDGLRMPPIKLMIDVERLVVLDVVAQTFTDDGQGNGVLVAHAVQTLGTSEVSFFGEMIRTDPVAGRAFLGHFIRNEGFPSKRQTIDRCNRYFDAAERRLQLSPAEREGAPDPSAIMDEAKEKFDLVLGVMLPAFDRLPRLHDRAQTGAVGTRAMLAIEIYRATRGEYPEGLSDLVPEYLGGVPGDVLCAPAPLRYRRTPGGYLLYSTGADRTDDGGTPSPEPLDAFDARKGRGFDVLLNVP